MCEKYRTLSDKPKLNNAEAATFLGVSPATLHTWRCRHRGPKYSRLGSRILYDIDDLEAFFASRLVTPRTPQDLRRGN
jgi:hypothetical protein